MENLYIYNNARAVPEEALKKILAGRIKGFNDINPMWRIKKLTELFGPCGVGWKVEIVKKWTEQGTDGTVSAFMDVNLYIKVDDKWSEAIPGTGGSSFVSKEKNGYYVSDECYKMAYTDALSVSCKMLGVAADVYYENDRTKYDINNIQETKEQPNPKDNRKILTGESLLSEKMMEWIYKNESVAIDSGIRFSVLNFMNKCYRITDDDMKRLLDKYEQYKINNNLP